VIGKRRLDDCEVAPRTIPPTQDGGHLRIRLKDVNPVRSQTVEEHGDMSALLSADVGLDPVKLRQREFRHECARAA
jgi:hypothetical protein